MERLKELISHCDYDLSVSTALLVGIFISGFHLKLVQSALLKEGKDLTAERALQVAPTQEATRQHTDNICSDRDEKVINFVAKEE